MTITKNDFFTANNFKTLQDIGKKYPEWKDFCMTIVSQMDDKFGVTMFSETTGEVKQLFFLDYKMAEILQLPELSASELQKDKLYLYKLYAVADTASGMQIKSKELYDTGVNIAQMPPYIKGKSALIDGIECVSITLQNDGDSYNVGDTLLSLDTMLADEAHTDVRSDYNGAMYEVIKVEGKNVYLRTKDDTNTPFKEAQALYLYKKK